jgi:3-keto-5-aminohexanoate cleavage enzyme
MDKLIITAALTGGIHGKEANHVLPEQPDEIIRDAFDCYNAGAAVVHLHARDLHGNGVGDPNIFGEINSGLRAKCKVVIQNTTGGPGIPINERIKSLDADPDSASLNMGSIVFFYQGKEVTFYNLRSEIEVFAAEMIKRDIKPELETYNPSMFGEIENLISKGLLNKPCYVNIVLGVGGMGGYPGTPENLVTMIRQLPEGSKFNVTGIGRYQLGLNTMAILAGGNTRVGLEDNVFYKKGELAKSNAQFVERVVRLARELGREIATPEEAREILGIKKR